MQVIEPQLEASTRAAAVIRAAMARDHKGRVRATWLIAVMVATYPLYSWLAGGKTGPMLYSMRISDAWLALWLSAAIVHLCRRSREWRRDSFVLLSTAFLGYRIAVDYGFGLSPVPYLARSVLVLVTYLVAKSAWAAAPPLRVAVGLAFSTYVLFSVPQLTDAVAGTRLTSLHLNPNFLAFNLLHLLACSHFIHKAGGGWLFRILSVAGVVLTRTRSVLLALPILYLRTGRYRLLGFAFVFGLLLVPAEVLRLDDQSHVGSLNGRTEIWKRIYSRLYRVDLITGGGTDVVNRKQLTLEPGYVAIERLVQPQNHYILTLLETGVVGLLMWCTAVLCVIRQSWPHRSDPSVGYGLAYVLALLLIQMSENDIFANPLVSVNLGLIWARIAARTARLSPAC